VTYIIESLGFGKLEGNTLKSPTVRYLPRNIVHQHSTDPQRIEKDVGSAGSISLVLQAILPIFLFQSSQSPTELIIKGGTNVNFSPPIDHFENVLLPLLSRMGVNVQLISGYRRGYFPIGGGRVQLSIQANSHECLEPLVLVEQGMIESINCVIYGNDDLEDSLLRLKVRIEEALLEYVASLTSSHETRRPLHGIISPHFQGITFHSSTVSPLTSALSPSSLECAEDKTPQETKSHRSVSSSVPRRKGGVVSSTQGGEYIQKKKQKKNSDHSLGAQITLLTSTGCVLSSNYFLCERNEDILFTAPETITSELMSRVHHLVGSRSCVDEQTADQLLVYMALANSTNGESRILCEPFVNGRSSQHLETAVYVLNELLGSRGCHLQIETEEDTGCRLVTCCGIGYRSV
jgi:RNA 3'-terminal phosphate cyclase